MAQKITWTQNAAKDAHVAFLPGNETLVINRDAFGKVHLIGMVGKIFIFDKTFRTNTAPAFRFAESLLGPNGRDVLRRMRHSRSVRLQRQRRPWDGAIGVHSMRRRVWHNRDKYVKHSKAYKRFWGTVLGLGGVLRLFK
jgi:transcriptional regulator with XRE-family HTH domain